MKVILMKLSLVLLIPAFLHAEPAINWSQGKECNLYIESVLDNTASQLIYMSLRTDIFSNDNPGNTGWYYYIVHSDKTKQRLLNAFLPNLQRYHRHSKLPFSAVSDYWEKKYDVPMQIYVFSDKDGQADALSTSYACEQIISAAHMLKLGFLWNGAATIAENEIKQILNVPSERSMITAIFLYRSKDQRLTQAVP